MTTRITLNDLSPDTDYVIQLRRKDGDRTSDWSRKFPLHTVANNHQPKVPANVVWSWVGTSAIAYWDAVEKDVNDKNAEIVRYEFEVKDNVGLSVKSASITQQTNDDRLQWELTQRKNKSWFPPNGAVNLNFRVRAVNGNEIKSDWSAWFTANSAAPDAPTNFTAVGITDGVVLKWDASTTDGVRYELHASTAGSGFTPSSLNLIYSGSSTSFNFGTTTYSAHSFKICAVDRFGRKSTYALATATPVNPFVLDTAPPPIPGITSVVVDRSGAVARALVTWTFSSAPPNDDIQSFAIRYKKPADSEWYMAFAAEPARTLYVDLPQPYANYDFQIASMDFVGNYSAWSATTTLSSGIAGAPPATAGLAVVPGFGDLQISWTPSTHDDVTYGGYYEVQVSTNSGFTGSPLTYKTGNTSLAVAGLALSTAYWVRVRAVDVDGNQGAYSTAWTGSTTGVTIPTITDGNPVTSSPAAVATSGIGSIYVQWATVANADPVTYEVHASTTAGFTPTLGGATKVAETPGTIVTLLKDPTGTVFNYTTPWYFRVIAKDADTNSGNAPAPGTVSAGVSARKSTGADTTLIMDNIAAGNFAGGNFLVASGGSIRSTGYSPGASGYMLSDTVVDIQSGVVNFSTLKAGTITSTTVKIGLSGVLQIDSTGIIKSNTYNGTGVPGSGSTGWALGSSGLDLPGLAITAGQMTGDAINGRAITVGSSGYVQSSSYSAPTAGGGYTNGLGWRLDYNGLAVYGGSIYGPTVITNQLYSATHDSNSPLTATRPGGGGSYNPSFGINSSGYAVFAGANIYGNTTVASGSSHMVQTSGYSPGASSGWRISGDGNAYFGNIELGSGGSITTGSTYSTRLSQGGVQFITTASGSGGVSPGFSNVQLHIWAPYNSGSGTSGRIILDSSANTMTHNGRAYLDNITLGNTGNFNVNFGGLTNVGDIGGRPNFGLGLTASGGSIAVSGAAITTTHDIRTNFGGVSTGGLYDEVWIAAGAGTPTINGSGRIIRSSTIKMKEEIELMTYEEAHSVLGLESYTFKYKKSPDEEDFYRDPRRYPGFIAEQGAEVGAELWVGRQHNIERDEDGNIVNIERDENGEIVHFRTSDITVAHNVLIKELYERIETLESLVESLT